MEKIYLAYPNLNWKDTKAYTNYDDAYTYLANFSGSKVNEQIKELTIDDISEEDNGKPIIIITVTTDARFKYVTHTVALSCTKYLPESISNGEISIDTKNEPFSDISYGFYVRFVLNSQEDKDFFYYKNDINGSIYIRNEFEKKIKENRELIINTIGGLLNEGDFDN